MDPLWYARRSMVAIFLFIVGTAIAVELNAINYLIGLVSFSSTAINIFIAIVAGFGLPLAVGLIFERIVSVFLYVFRLEMQRYPCNALFKKNYDNIMGGELVCSKSDASLFHAYFYNYAGKEIIQWSRRRRAQGITLLTIATAIIPFVIIISIVKHEYPAISGTISLVLASLFIAQGIRQLLIHKNTLYAWAETVGKEILTRNSLKLSN